MIYLDHAATTRLHPQALKAMLPYLNDEFGNPGGVYGLGRKSRIALDEARETIAVCLGCLPKEILFTSGGTEFDNLAIKGVAYGRPGRKHMVTSSIEHHAVLHTVNFLEQQGWSATYVAVDDDGLVDPKTVRNSVTPETALVSIMLANNEVGTIQPISDIAVAVRQQSPTTLLHTDAVQAAGILSLDVNELGVDLLSLSGHKFGGPRGTGVLFARAGIPLVPLMHGGSQEQDRRAGTENVAGAVGLATALKIACDQRESHTRRMTELRDRLVRGILDSVPDSRLNGHPAMRLATNVSVSFDGIDGETLMMGLDMAGIAASIGSACTSASLEPSHVLTAMGVTTTFARGTARFTLGPETTEEEIDRVLAVLPTLIDRLRRA